MADRYVLDPTGNVIDTGDPVKPVDLNQFSNLTPAGYVAPGTAQANASTAPATPSPATPITTTNVVDLNADLAGNPTVPTGTTVTPVKTQTSPGEFLNGLPSGALQTTSATASKASATPVIAPPPAQVSQQDALTTWQARQQAMQGGQYDPALAGNQTPQAVAAQGTVDPNATMKGQLAALMGEWGPNDQAPIWAQAAMREAEERMAARGLGASSLAGQAIAAAIMESGIKIAEFDAMRYAEMDLANLTNEQQTNLENTKMRHASLLTDLSAQNAALQFNAQNKTQVAQFFAGLIGSIDKFNVEQANAMKQFNSSQTLAASMKAAELGTQVDLKNAEMASAISQFNAQQADAMVKFQSQQQLLIDQSNAQWRRDINVADTAAENAANQLNAMNLLEISNTAMNNIWQMARDNASWYNQASENELDRKANLAIAAFNRDTQFDLMDENTKNSIFSALGSFALDILRRKL